MKNQSLVGSVTAASRFEDTRQVLFERLSEAVKTSLDGDEMIERQRLLDSLRQTALISATLQTGALGLALATAAQLVDPLTGLSVASALAMGGGAWFVSGTSRIRTIYEKDWNTRAKKLDAALEAICQKELDRVNRRILDGVAPYTRFVETEKDRIGQLGERCEGVTSAARNLRNRIGKLQ
jgi:hypothetical protein